MSKTKSGGSASNLKDSPGQRLGVKLFAGQEVKSGAVLVRQRGSSKIAGPGTAYGRDHTIYATKDGKVDFVKTRKVRFSGQKVPRTMVKIV
ncbi:MAG: 50S ribosomal protein L27 [Candidatus Saccharimonadales bacterium]